MPNKIILEPEVIKNTLVFIRKQGANGFEARVYWIGVEESGNKIRIIRAEIPRQIPRRTVFGVSVTVPEQANVDLARKLKIGEYIAVKVHSHPRAAYNSDTDKTNPFLRHEGAFSIIVPDFGAKGMDIFSNCAVCYFTNGEWWDLTKNQIKELFTV